MTTNIMIYSILFGLMSGCGGIFGMELAPSLQQEITVDRIIADENSRPYVRNKCAIEGTIAHDNGKGKLEYCLSLKHTNKRTGVNEKYCIRMNEETFSSSSDELKESLPVMELQCTRENKQLRFEVKTESLKEKLTQARKTHEENVRLKAQLLKEAQEREKQEALIKKDELKRKQAIEKEQKLATTLLGDPGKVTKVYSKFIDEEVLNRMLLAYDLLSIHQNTQDPSQHSLILGNEDKDHAQARLSITKADLVDIIKENNNQKVTTVLKNTIILNDTIPLILIKPSDATARALANQSKAVEQEEATETPKELAEPFVDTHETNLVINTNQSKPGEIAFPQENLVLTEPTTPATEQADEKDHPYTQPKPVEELESAPEKAAADSIPNDRPFVDPSEFGALDEGTNPQNVGSALSEPKAQYLSFEVCHTEIPAGESASWTIINIDKETNALECINKNDQTEKIKLEIRPSGLDEIDVSPNKCLQFTLAQLDQEDSPEFQFLTETGGTVIADFSEDLTDKLGEFFDTIKTPESPAVKSVQQPKANPETKENAEETSVPGAPIIPIEDRSSANCIEGIYCVPKKLSSLTDKIDKIDKNDGHYSITISCAGETISLNIDEKKMHEIKIPESTENTQLLIEAKLNGITTYLFVNHPASEDWKEFCTAQRSRQVDQSAAQPQIEFPFFDRKNLTQETEMIDPNAPCGHHKELNIPANTPIVKRGNISNIIALPQSTTFADNFYNIVSAVKNGAKESDGYSLTLYKKDDDKQIELVLIPEDKILPYILANVQAAYNSRNPFMTISSGQPSITVCTKHLAEYIMNAEEPKKELEQTSPAPQLAQPEIPAVKSVEPANLKTKENKEQLSKKEARAQLKELEQKRIAEETRLQKEKETTAANLAKIEEEKKQTEAALLAKIKEKEEQERSERETTQRLQRAENNLLENQKRIMAKRTNDPIDSQIGNGEVPLADQKTNIKKPVLSQDSKKQLPTMKSLGDQKTSSSYVPVIAAVALGGIAGILAYLYSNFDSLSDPLKEMFANLSAPFIAIRNRLSPA